MTNEEEHIQEVKQVAQENPQEESQEEIELETSQETQKPDEELVKATAETITKEHQDVEYKCFSCNKIVSETYIKKKVRCPYCGSKIIFKGRHRPNSIPAR
jgi:DNA-directed RNA polymerase subunit RPC12/RpoP